MRTTILLLALALHGLPAPAQKAPDLPKEADANDWQSYYEAGTGLLRRRPDKAERYFEYAALLEPTVAEPLVARYVAWWRQRPDMWWMDYRGDRLVQNDKGVKEAQQWMDRARLINPFVRTSLFILSMPDDFLQNVTRGNDARDRGIYDFYEGRWASAAKEFTAALEEHPDWWGLHYYRGLSNVQLRRWGPAQGDFRAYMDSISDLRASKTIFGDLRVPDIHYALGLMYLLAGSKSKAKEAFHQSFTEDLAFYMGHMHYGSLLLEEGDTAQALNEYAQAVELKPDDEVLRYNYGTALLTAGQFQAATEQFARAIELNQLYAAPYYNNAVSHERLGNIDEARAMFAAYLERAPRRYAEQITMAQERVGAR